MMVADNSNVMPDHRFVFSSRLSREDKENKENRINEIDGINGINGKFPSSEALPIKRSAPIYPIKRAKGY